MGNTAETLKPTPVDTEVVQRLRQRWGDAVKHLNDVELYKAFKDFTADEVWREDDFLEWIS